MPNMLTLSEVSKRHGVSVATLRRWIAEGRIPTAEQSQIKIGSGRVWLVPEEAEIPVPIDQGKRAPNYNHSPKNEGLTQIN